jgi:glycosyltransferase involved in cell wall biosynthesis
MSTPFFTALVDTFNHGRFIEEAVASVLAQDFPPGEVEVLVVDDGSADDTPQRVRRFGARVRLLCKSNGGQASALNAGFAEARGEVVAMLDGDDVWLPHKLRRVAEIFAAHPDAGAVYHPYIYWDSQAGIETPDTHFTPLGGWIPGRLEDMLRYGAFGTCGMALRRSVARRLLPVPEDLVIYADTYIVGVLPFIAPLASTPECLTKYRHHGDNLASFAALDFARAARRSTCYAAAVRAIRGWLERNALLDAPGVPLYLRRHALVEQMLRFLAEPPGRAEFFRYLRERERVYAPLRPPAYRFFQSLTSCAGFLLGYRGFEWLRSTYAAAPSLRSLRGRLFPHAHRREAAA